MKLGSRGAWQEGEFRWVPSPPFVADASDRAAHTEAETDRINPGLVSLGNLVPHHLGTCPLSQTLSGLPTVHGRNMGELHGFGDLPKPAGRREARI